MNNEIKTGRGGARPNSGMKSSGIETVTVRIDKRLLNAVTTIKTEFKDGKLSLDDILNKSSSNLESENKKLLKQIEELESERRRISGNAAEFLKDSRIKIDELNDDISVFKMMIERRDKLIEKLRAGGNSGGLEVKQIKRLIQFLHPDKQVNEKNRAIATELTALLNGLRGGQDSLATLSKYCH